MDPVTTRTVATNYHQGHAQAHNQRSAYSMRMSLSVSTVNRAILSLAITAAPAVAVGTYGSN